MIRLRHRPVVHVVVALCVVLLCCLAIAWFTHHGWPEPRQTARRRNSVQALVFILPMMAVFYAIIVGILGRHDPDRRD
jgi:hypothetical protein